MENTARLTFLFAEYLDKKLSPEELEEMLALLQNAEADALLTPSMQTIWDQLKEDKSNFSVDWQKMYSTVTSTNPISTPNPYLKRILLYKAVAAVCILSIGAGIYWFSGNTGNKTSISLAKKHVTPQLRIIHLPDGSTVILNTNSKLDYTSSFKGNDREVYLSGEGFFDITPDPDKPFIVHTGNIATKVLGTSFNIKAYPADQTIKVTVATGKVQVLENSRSIGLITANEQLWFDTKTNSYLKEKVNVTGAIAWKSPEIVFNDITMEEVAIQMQERFGMQVGFEIPALKNCRVTATFSQTDQPEQMLTVLCAVSGSTYTIQNNKITIYGKGCQ